MKRIATILIALIVFLFAGAASAASEYTVKKGDTLSKIGKQFQISWKVLARENQLKNPDRIYPNQKIQIPEEFSWEHAAADPFKGTLNEALVLLGYSKEVAALLKDEVVNDRYADIAIKNGDRLKAMTFGKNIVKTNVISKVKKVLPARQYSIEYQGIIYQLIYPLICGNWSRMIDIATPPPPKEKAPEPAVLQPIISEAKKPLIELKPLQPHRKLPALIMSEELRCVDIELNVRQGFWWGESAHGEFSYAEGGVWDSCWYWGRMAGFYANRDSGKVPGSGYEWDAWGIGPQVGLRYLDFYKRDDGTIGWHGWTAKLRLTLAKVWGVNPHSLYHMSQYDILVALYVEYVRQLSEKTTVALTFEAWFSLWSTIDSSWSGDKPSNRGWIQAGGYVQHKIDDDWAVRVGAYGFYHLWDEESGIGGFAEGRYDDWLLAGVYANLGFENGLTKGVYVGAEPGVKISKNMNQKIDDSIWAVDEQSNPLENRKEKEGQKVSTDETDELEDVLYPKAQELSYSPKEI